jgi:hypothetical protein
VEVQLLKTTPVSLHHLSQVELNPASRSRLNEVLATSGGDSTWRARKAAEATELLALAQVAPARIAVFQLDLTSSFRTVIALNVPVPCRIGDEDLTIESGALLGLDYPREAVSQPTPGYAFVTVLQPQNVWHANVHLPDQALCLGPKMPAGIRVRSLIWLSYSALAMTTTQTNPGDTAGVMNVAAAEWWNHNWHRVPLSREPFLPPTQPH